jgi:hypothetical protein
MKQMEDTKTREAYIPLGSFLRMDYFYTHTWVWVCSGPSIYYSRFLLAMVDKEKIALYLLLLSNLKAKRAVTETLTLYTYKSISDFFLQIPMHEERNWGPGGIIISDYTCSCDLILI